MTATAQIHEVPASAVLTLLRSRADGLQPEEVAARRAEVGPNRLTPPSRWRWLRLLFKQAVNYFSLLLDVAALVCFLAAALEPGAGMAVLGWALLAVSLLNTLFAFVQELRAEQAMAALRRFLPPRVRVRRAGGEQEVLADELVPGDLLLLGEGDRIAADGRLIESEDLLVDNAPLTGESRARALKATPARGRSLDCHNIAFAGCSVLRGRGTAVVFATGHRTELGKIAALARDVVRPPAPLQREINRMVRILTAIAVTMGVLFFAVGLASDRPLWVNLVFMLGIIVANVPEGLLPTFTLALSMAAVRMARKQVLVKNLEAIETLGAVHVICTDKTGTLTRNQLAVTALVDPVQGRPLDDPAAVRELLEAALAACEVRAVPGTGTASTQWRGDPLDVTLVEYHAARCGPPARLLADIRRHFPFDLARRREAGVRVNGDGALFAIKGAWESLRPLIGTLRAPDGTSQPATAAALDAADTLVRDLARRGQRVIAVAARRLESPPDQRAPEASLERELCLHGFIAFDDPIRPGVPEAVARAHEAGIAVLMITGDHPETAAAVARRCGILPASGEDGTAVLSGAELDGLREDALVERLRAGVRVCARTTPEQKMKIVMALKRLGRVVAMTGDGVNDAPALKAADVGIAMGASGTEVAREAADLVLLDDHFASILAGIEEGRAVFANMRKFTTYVLASNIPEILPFLLYVLLPVPLALTVIQILSIDLGTDLLPAIGLGQERPEADTMRQPPRPLEARLLSPRLMVTAYLFLGLIQAAYALALFFLYLHWGGWIWGRPLAGDDPLYQSASGLMLATVVLMQIANVIGRRAHRGSGLDRGLWSNRLILLGIAVELGFAWAVLDWTPAQAFLNTGPVAWPWVALAALGIPLLLGLDWLRKGGAATVGADPAR